MGLRWKAMTRAGRHLRRNNTGIDVDGMSEFYEKNQDNAKLRIASNTHNAARMWCGKFGSCSSPYDWSGLFAKTSNPPPRSNALLSCAKRRFVMFGGDAEGFECDEDVFGVRAWGEQNPWMTGNVLGNEAPENKDDSTPFASQSVESSSHCPKRAGSRLNEAWSANESKLGGGVDDEEEEDEDESWKRRAVRCWDGPGWYSSSNTFASSAASFSRKVCVRLFLALSSYSQSWPLRMVVHCLQTGRVPSHRYRIRISTGQEEPSAKRIKSISPSWSTWSNYYSQVCASWNTTNHQEINKKWEWILQFGFINFEATYLHDRQADPLLRVPAVSDFRGIALSVVSWWVTLRGNKSNNSNA